MTLTIDYSDTEYEDCDKVDYTVRLQLNSVDFVTDLYNDANLKIPKVSIITDIVNVINVSDIYEEPLNYTKAEDEDIYDEVSVKHNSHRFTDISTISEQDGYISKQNNHNLLPKVSEYKPASPSVPIFHYTKYRRGAYTIHSRPLPPIPPPTLSLSIAGL